MRSIKSIISLSSLLLLCGSLSGFAQIGSGGFPLSFSQTNNVLSGNKVVFESSKFSDLLRTGGDEKSEKYNVGWTVPANKNLMESGTWTFLPDGASIYKIAVSVPNAKAVALYYNYFHLPKGVKLFIYNSNRRQVLGAYTNDQNTEAGSFSNQPIVGDVAFLELNLESGVNPADIKLDLDFVGAYYRGVDLDVQTYAADVPLLNDPPIGSTASCHVNAMCPGVDIADKSRKATLRIVIADQQDGALGYCSGTMINNTGNTANGTCKPLFLTASHCDGENGMTDNHFKYWQFRFNYQLDGCTTGANPTDITSPTITGGAKYKARSFYPTFASTNPETSSLVQDFLLLELNDAIPAGYFLAGWNRKTNIAADVDVYNTFYGFHHPSGDIKKQSIGYTLSSNGVFNQNTVSSTHWGITFSTGGTSPGSSGSGLFDVAGLLVGDLSGGASGNCPGENKKYGQSALYSKISYAWENAYDQTAFPAQAGATSRLKESLDPLNLGLTSLGPTIAGTCSDMPPVTSVGKNELKLVDLILFPNPSNDGKINVQVNVPEKATFNLEVVDINGRVLRSFHFENTVSSIQSMDLSELSNGMYFLKVNSTVGTGNYKFILNK